MSSENAHESAAANDSDLSSAWVKTLSWDVTKLTAGLYLIGTITSIAYYSRYSILTLDLVRAQSILIGCYVMLLYLAVPLLTLWFLRGIQSSLRISSLLLFILTISDITILWLSGSRGLIFSFALGIMVLLQFLCVLEPESILLSLQQKRLTTRFQIVPEKSRIAVMTALFCWHFAMTIFPQIPMYVGGAKPLQVWIFTKTPDLAAISIVNDTKNRTFNDSLDAYALNLLYESDKDMYFLTEITANKQTLGHLVTRIPKDEILRVNYETPKWVTWR